MRRDPRFILATFYLTNFAVLGLFVPYFSLYLRSLEFSATRIGILLALIPLAKAVLPGVWGRAADNWGIRRGIMIFSTWGAMAVFMGFLQVTSFAGCLLILAGYAALSVPSLPLVEATTLEYVASSGADYGRIRVAGSVGFALTALMYGPLMGTATVTAVVPAMLVLLALSAACTSLVPVQGRMSRASSLSMARLLRLPGIGLLLAAGFLMQSSHGAYIGFFSIILEENGYSPGVIGLSWAGAIVAEVILMLLSARLVTTLGTSKLMATAVAVAALRWFLYAFSVAPAALVVGQAMHAFTYAGFHVAAVQVVQRLVPAGSRATGQALYSGWTYGAGIMAGTLLAGIVKDHLGAAPMFSLSGFMALAALVIILARPGRRPQSASMSRSTL
jgi:PPP family 3-phenylpropionic acid transporter